MVLHAGNGENIKRGHLSQTWRFNNTFYKKKKKSSELHMRKMSRDNQQGEFLKKNKQQVIKTCFK